MSNEEKLTVKEALEQGYTQYGTDSSGFQWLHQIEDLNPVDFEKARSPFFIADKEAEYVGFSEDEIIDWIIDQAMDQHPTDDEHEIPKQLREALSEDLKPITEKINKVLQDHPWYALTRIQLIP